MENLVQNYSKRPDICFIAVNIVNESLWCHVERRAYVHISKFLSELWKKYLDWTAKPKSAILTVSPLRKMFAGFKSLCMIFF